MTYTQIFPAVTNVEARQRSEVKWAVNRMVPDDHFTVPILGYHIENQLTLLHLFTDLFREEIFLAHQNICKVITGVSVVVYWLSLTHYEMSYI